MPTKKPKPREWDTRVSIAHTYLIVGRWVGVEIKERILNIWFWGGSKYERKWILFVQKQTMMDPTLSRMSEFDFLFFSSANAASRLAISRTACLKTRYMQDSNVDDCPSSLIIMFLQLLLLLFLFFVLIFSVPPMQSRICKNYWQWYFWFTVEYSILQQWNRVSEDFPPILTYLWKKVVVYMYKY